MTFKMAEPSNSSSVGEQVSPKLFGVSPEDAFSITVMGAVRDCSCSRVFGSNAVSIFSFCLCARRGRVNMVGVTRNVWCTGYSTHSERVKI